MPFFFFNGSLFGVGLTNVVEGDKQEVRVDDDNVESSLWVFNNSDSIARIVFCIVFLMSVWLVSNTWEVFPLCT